MKEGNIVVNCMVSCLRVAVKNYFVVGKHWKLLRKFGDFAEVIGR